MNTVLRLVQPADNPQGEQDTNPLPTLIELFELYIDRKKDKLKASTLKGYRQCIRVDLGEWQQLRIDQITRMKVSEKHAAISQKNSQYGKGSAQADFVMRLLRALMNYARAIYRDADDEPILKSNPVEVLKDAREWNKKKARTNYLHEDQLAPFWKATATTPYPVIRDWLRFILLTGFRKNEARLLRWSDVDFAKRVITLKDTKNDREHNFPITSHLQKMLRERSKYAPPDTTFVFGHPDGSNSPLPYNTKRQEEVSAESGSYWTLHDLRRSYAQACYTNELSEVAIKSLLNHARHGVTEKHYLGATNLRAVRGPAQRVEDYLLSYCTGAVEPPSETYDDEDEVEEAEPPNVKEKIRLRVSLVPVAPIAVTARPAAQKPVAKQPVIEQDLEPLRKPYKRPDYAQLRKNAEENRARVSGSVEF
ncbi:MAG: tyrosine-type recombinase/integrase [Candidatus Obscuribacterales bacterium]|jgi:integrase